jgi:hypothetical protein
MFDPQRALQRSLNEQESGYAKKYLHGEYGGPISMRRQIFRTEEGDKVLIHMSGYNSKGGDSA